MNNYNIIYYIDNKPIFKSFKNPKNTIIIVNYLTYQANKECIKKALINDLYYYEILIDPAINIIKKDILYLYNKVEQYLLKFIQALISESPDDLIVYLHETNYFSKKELETIENEFNKTLNCY